MTKDKILDLLNRIEVNYDPSKEQVRIALQSVENAVNSPEFQEIEQAMTKEITFESLCEEIPDEQKAWLDRSGNFPVTDSKHGKWHKDGYLILKNFIPNELIDAYVARYERDNGKDAPIGYKTGTPYMQVDEIKDLSLYAPLMEILNSLIGEPMGMSLNLCNWISTERNWHQDDYLNPPEVNGHYLACWFALDDIHPDSGVFEFVPGSHKWPVMRGEKVRALLEPHEAANPDWPRIAERFLDEVFEEKINSLGKPSTTSWRTAQKGDVLIWHSWLAHRGSKPKNPNLLRKSLITHYSGINHRPDMQKPLLWENGVSKGHFFPF